MVHSQRILRLLLKRLLFEDLLLLLAIVGPILLLLLGLTVHRRVPGGHWRSVVLRLHGKGHLLLLLLLQWRSAANDGVLGAGVLWRLQCGSVNLLLWPHHHTTTTAYHSRADRHAKTADTPASATVTCLPRLTRAFAAPRLHQPLLLLVFPLHGAVPVVLNGVVRPARDELGNLGPLVAPLLVCIVNDAVLLLGPRGLLYLRVEMVVPTFPTLFTFSVGKVFSDVAPLVRTEVLY